MFTRILTLLCAVIVVATAIDEDIPIIVRQRGRARCGRRCRFSFCRGRQVNRFPAPNKVSTPLICRPPQDIDAILEIGENLVVPVGQEPIPISKWRPAGLTRRFKKKFFKPRPIPGQDNYGLARSPARGNQNDFTDNQCFIIPILRYERARRRNGITTIKVIETSDPERDCLAFEARTPKIQIEVQWNSGDDLDLIVIEPNGDQLNSANDETACGTFGTDSGVDACEIRQEGAERIWYDPDCAFFQKGRYKAVVRQAANCQNGPTNWEIRLVVDGRIVKKKRGTSNEDEGKRIGVMRFNL